MSKYVIKNGTFVAVGDDAMTRSRNIRYVDLYPDEMVHFKYIRKEKLSNGKYRYYYDEDGLLNDAYNDMHKADRAAKRTEKEFWKAAGEENDVKAKKPGVYTYEVAAAEDKTDELGWATDTLRKKAKQAKRKYELKKVVSFPRRTVGKGIAAILNLFSKKK